MQKILYILFILAPFIVKAQTQIIIDASIQHQTIYGFGASDAWNCHYVGQYWQTTVKDDIAKKLFSKSFDADGNPEGIGLSRWRFNIGAGSAEQAGLSNIESEERRAECFLNENGTYNWDKQKGQQWFINQAKNYGVENLVAFINSPPRFFTLNGRANSDNTNNYGPTNIKSDSYDNFAAFMVNVIKHFNNNGTPISQISPVNEPQYSWANGQEGCPYTNTDITKVVSSLNAELTNEGLNTKILLAEAGSYKYLYQTEGDANKSNQFENFFDKQSQNYLGNYSQVLPGLGAHSYWTDGDDATIRSVREAVFNKSQQMGKLQVYQTEYNLLSKSFDTYWDNSLFLAKIIHADLAIANASIWDYWTARDRERWGQLNRFFLIRLIPTGGDYADLTTGGSVEVTKNLWALGNYSRFIRPGYKRVNLTGADNLAGLMGSAYIAPDSLKMVLVYVNYGATSVNITHEFNNLPNGAYIKTITPYLTNINYNLTPQAQISTASNYKIKPQSITTLVVELGNNLININQSSFDSNKITVYPNPGNGVYTISFDNKHNKPQILNIKNIIGQTVKTIQINNDHNATIDISNQPAGVYFINAGSFSTKIIKQ